MNELDILQTIYDYVKDERQKQAILINGAWGSGKTHFAKEILLPNIADDISPEKLSQQVVYVSLYGLVSTEEIFQEIYQNLLQSMVAMEQSRQRRGQKLGRFGLKFLSSAAAQDNNQLMEQGRVRPYQAIELRELLNIQTLTIIFDDLERCNIDMNVVLGFINNLVEHYGIKGIIIANEEEISQEAEGKFSYANVKEKLIDLTIAYNPNFDQLFDTILEQNTRIPQAKALIIAYKPQILQIFQDHQYNNVRTLIFIIVTFETLCRKLKDLETPPFLIHLPATVQDEIRNTEYFNLLHYVTICSIRVKMGQPYYDWSEESAYYGQICWGSSKKENCFFGYYFIDEVIRCQNYRSDIASETFLQRLKQVHDEKIEETKGLSIFRLENNNWMFLEEVAVYHLLIALKDEIYRDEYQLLSYQKIIYTLVQLQEYDIHSDFIFSMLDDVLEGLRRSINKAEDKSLAYRLLDGRYGAETEEMRKLYECLITPLLEEIQPEPTYDMAQFHAILAAGSPDWGAQFFHLCDVIPKNVKSKDCFFSALDLELLEERLAFSQITDIYDFNSAVQEVYIHGNIRERFADDFLSIERFYLRIKTLRRHSPDKIRVLALIKLEDTLKFLAHDLSPEKQKNNSSPLSLDNFPNIQAEIDQYHENYSNELDYRDYDEDDGEGDSFWGNV